MSCEKICNDGVVISQTSSGPRGIPLGPKDVVDMERISPSTRVVVGQGFDSFVSERPREHVGGAYKSKNTRVATEEWTGSKNFKTSVESTVEVLNKLSVSLQLPFSTLVSFLPTVGLDVTVSAKSIVSSVHVVVVKSTFSESEHLDIKDLSPDDLIDKVGSENCPTHICTAIGKGRNIVARCSLRSVDKTSTFEAGAKSELLQNVVKNRKVNYEKEFKEENVQFEAFIISGSAGDMSTDTVTKIDEFWRVVECFDDPPESGIGSGWSQKGTIMARYSPLLHHKNFHMYFPNVETKDLNLKFKDIVERQLGVHDLLDTVKKLKERMGHHNTYTKHYTKGKIDACKEKIAELEDLLEEGTRELANGKRDLKDKKKMTEERFEDMKDKYTPLMNYDELNVKYTDAFQDLETWIESTHFDPTKDDGAYYMESFAFPGKYLKIAGDFSNIWTTPEIVPVHIPTTVNINASKESGRRRIWKHVGGKNLYVWFDEQGDIESIDQPDRDRAQLYFKKHSDGAYSIQYENKYLCMNDNECAQSPHAKSWEKFWIYQ